MEDKTLVIISVVAIAGLSLIITPILTWILSRQKEKALEALKAYAEAGREPPPELLKAISSNLDVWGMGAAGNWADWGVGGRWSNVITSFGVAIGFGVAAIATNEPVTHPFWIVAIVCGALGLGGLAQALLSSRAK